MIREKTERSETIIDLTGPDGNAFVLFGYAKRFARELGLDGDRIINEMKKETYEELILTFDKYFGDYVILER